MLQVAPIVSLLFSVAYFAFLIWMLVDSVRTMGLSFWVFLIFFFQPFGAILYFAIYVVPTLDVGRRVDRLVTGRRRLRELRAQAHQLDRAYHWTQLGNEYRDRGKMDDAGKCYETALEREPGNEEASYGLGLARLAQGRYDDALDLLDPIAGDDPGYSFGEGMLAFARAWRGLERYDEAAAAYEKVMSRYTYPEAQYEAATLMVEHGDKERGIGLLKQLVADGKNATGFSRGKQWRWGMRANLYLKTHAR